MRLTCGCLNVQINAKCKELKPSDIGDFATTAANGNAEPDPFFQGNLCEISLDLEGIRIEIPCLLKSHMWKEWKIHRCLNCDMLTHAEGPSLGSGKILINTSLKSDPTIHDSLLKSPDFSPLYKVVIHNKNDNFQVKSLGLESGQYESLRKVLTTIQKQLDSFLSLEEVALETRIRKFEEQQRSQFAELQSKVRRDKNVLISIVLANEDESKPAAANVFKEPNVEPKTTETKPKTLVNKVKPPQNMKPEKTYPKTAAKKEKEMNLDFDEIDVFDLEDVDDGRAFYNSDDENDDTDDSTNDEAFNSRSRARGPNPRYMMSSSVPVSVPEWRSGQGRGRSIANVSDDEDSDKEGAPKDMAASIKALAQSVHGDGTEIFGDLPRRPRNAMDMGNI